MKKIAKIPVTFESRLSSEEFAEKVERIIAEQEENAAHSEKGRQIFCWEILGCDRYSLKFHHSYKSDMCDTAFFGKVNKGLSGCQLDGHIKKPAGIWAVFWIIAAAAVLMLAAFSIAILLSETPETGLIPIFLLTLIPAAFVEINLLMFDKKRLKAINEYLRDFTAAENVDVLGEDLEDDERS